MPNTKSAQLQYQGFLDTDFLWKSNSLNGLQQFEISETKTSVFTLQNHQNLRLGKWVERFVSFQLKEDSSIDILAENIQIQNKKITVGELDCILLQNNTPIHLEIVYKFYLYDNSVGNSEIEHWIGPNRKDSLIEKIDKLTQKQLPLLHNKHTAPYLSNINLSPLDIVQQVYFKAQLFVPYKDLGKTYSVININCIKGFYISFKELEQFSNAKFYMPTKHNWLVTPHTNINWYSYDNFILKIESYIQEKHAPLCWMKHKNGELSKLFVVWW